MVTTSMSLMTEKLCNLLINLNIPLNSYNIVLSDIVDACSYLNGMLISMSCELEKTKVFLNDAKNEVDERNSEIAGLDLKLKKHYG